MVIGSFFYFYLMAIAGGSAVFLAHMFNVVEPAVEHHADGAAAGATSLECLKAAFIFCGEAGRADIQKQEYQENIQQQQSEYDH
jgi:hypothetical protein